MSQFASYKKAPMSSSFAPAPSQFQPRPFAPQTQPSGVSPQAQPVPDLQTQLEQAERFGHNFSRILVSSSDITAPPAIQAKLIQPVVRSTLTTANANTSSNGFIQQMSASIIQRQIAKEAVQVSQSAEVGVYLKPLFRGMMADGNQPKIHSSARGLGVRVGDDIELEPGDIVAMNKQGKPAGMSVAPDDPRYLPEHRRPAFFGGKGKDPVWRISDDQLGSELAYRQDSSRHGVIGPAKQGMVLAEYQNALASTQDKWTLEPPEKT
ncbi:MAG: hypothetical protein AB1861_29080 [Cyanobacteriota bacterium]